MQLFAAMREAEHQTFGPVEIDVVSVGDARIKRAIYPAGLRWSVDLRPLAGTETCQHAHAGFLAHGALDVRVSGWMHRRAAGSCSRRHRARP